MQRSNAAATDAHLIQSLDSGGNKQKCRKQRTQKFFLQIHGYSYRVERIRCMNRMG
jgi:hypothetical protein